MKTRFEKFSELFTALSTTEKIALFNECASNYYPDEYLYSFDDEFFDTFFSGNPMDVARAIFFGNIQSWNDEYIYFNAYGNLASCSEYQAEQKAEDFMREIYEADCFSDYIDLSEEDEEEE